MEKKVTYYDTNKKTISGILSVPAKSTSIVILCHGLQSGKNSLTNKSLSKLFAKNKIATLRFDFYGHGESEGAIDACTMDIFIDDILQSINYAENIGFVNIALCAASFGGVAACLALSLNKKVKVVAFKAAGMGHTSRNNVLFKKYFDEELWIKAAKKINIPALIVHGTKDETVEVKYAQKLFHSIKQGKIVLIQGADHGFSKKADFNKMTQTIASFIIQKMKS